jgi:hypothetical protein
VDVVLPCARRRPVGLWSQVPAPFWTAVSSSLAEWCAAGRWSNVKGLGRAIFLRAQLRSHNADAI